eukprot:1191769-Prorocentrum_minimum.AAC.3
MCRSRRMVSCTLRVVARTRACSLRGSRLVRFSGQLEARMAQMAQMATRRAKVIACFSQGPLSHKGLCVRASDHKW